MSCTLGIDISTTSAKAMLVGHDGTVHAVGSTAQSISQPQPLWSEQHPHDWWNGVVQSIRAALSQADVAADEITAIGLTGQMHGLVMLDAQGQVLRPAILWNDQRTQPQCDAITAAIGFERLIELTGNRALTGFTAPKLLWVRDNEPDVYRRCAHVLLPKDYIRYRLTGDVATDLAGASGTLLLDVRQRNWSQEVTAALDIPDEWLPPVHEGTQVTGQVSVSAAEATGLRAGTSVVGGGGDQAAGAVGMGCVSVDTVGVTVGTSGVVFAPLDHYVFEPAGRLHAFCHAVPDMWHFMGVMLSAAGSLQWYRDTLAPQADFDTLLAEADAVAPGSDGLYFLPYLTGERTPHPDPDARGGFIGLTSRHTRGHMTRALLEGVAYGLKDSLTLIAQAGLPDAYTVRISGGGAKSPIWQRIIADILTVPLLNINTPEAGAFGAAILAAVGSGAHDTVPAACDVMVTVGRRVEPNTAQSAYSDGYATYRALYPALKQAGV